MVHVIVIARYLRRAAQQRGGDHRSSAIDRRAGRLSQRRRQRRALGHFAGWECLEAVVAVLSPPQGRCFGRRSFLAKRVGGYSDCGGRKLKSKKVGVNQRRQNLHLTSLRGGKARPWDVNKRRGERRDKMDFAGGAARLM